MSQPHCEAAATFFVQSAACVVVLGLSKVVKFCNFENVLVLTISKVVKFCNLKKSNKMCYGPGFSKVVKI